jgi:uncharacterized protein (UPF0248 family)
VGGTASGAYNCQMPTVREVLNRLRWAGGSPGEVVLEIRVRQGGAERIDEIQFADVAEILPRGVTVADGTFLPYHRVVAVRRGEEVLWPGGR